MSVFLCIYGFIIKYTSFPNYIKIVILTAPINIIRIFSFVRYIAKIVYDIFDTIKNLNLNVLMNYLLWFIFTLNINHKDIFKNDCDVIQSVTSHRWA